MQLTTPQNRLREIVLKVPGTFLCPMLKLLDATPSYIHPVFVLRFPWKVEGYKAAVKTALYNTERLGFGLTL